MIVQVNKLNTNHITESLNTIPKLCNQKLTKRGAPTFCALPQNDIMTLSSRFLKDTKKLSDFEHLKNAIREFYDKMIFLLIPPPTGPNANNKFFDLFRHEYVNSTGAKTAILIDPSPKSIEKIKEFYERFFPSIKTKTEKDIITLQKTHIEDLAKYTEESLKKWKKLEMWDANPNIKIPISKVIKAFFDPNKNTFNSPITVTGLENISKKKVKNPADLYNLLSQPFYNAIKYGEGKPIEIKIDKAMNDKYYMSFINPKTKPIPDAEIDKILEGKGYRVAGQISNINGNGTGMTEVLELLKKYGDEGDLKTIIQKGRKAGVHVRVPVIGIV